MNAGIMFMNWDKRLLKQKDKRNIDGILVSSKFTIAQSI